MFFSMWKFCSTITQRWFSLSCLFTENQFFYWRHDFTSINKTRLSGDCLLFGGFYLLSQIQAIIHLTLLFRYACKQQETKVLPKINVCLVFKKIVAMTISFQSVFKTRRSFKSPLHPNNKKKLSKLKNQHFCLGPSEK